jgi:hypothetical protein
MDVVVERRCRHCDKPLPLTARPDQRYCSAAHRQAAYERRRGPAQRSNRSVAVGESDPILAQLEAAVGKATQEHVLVGRIAAPAARGEWRARAWLLERQHPERWGRRDRETPPRVETPPDDPFAEVDQLAEQRRKRKRPNGF